MPAHHSQARKLHRATMQRKTRFCRFFLTEEGCANGASCSFAHGAEELHSFSLAKDSASNCSNTDDSTSVCSEDVCSSVCSADTASLNGGSSSSRQCWADVDDDDDEQESKWTPPSQPKMCELSIASQLPPSNPAEVTKATLKAERREQAAAAARAKRAMLTGAVLEGLLRQAQSPYLYQD